MSLAAPSGDGIRFHHAGDSMTAMPWASITLIEAIKVDCLTYDTIYLRFWAGTQFCEVCEDTPGFADVCESMGRCLVGVDPDWLSSVSRPPLEPSRVTVFRRAQPPT